VGCVYPWVHTRARVISKLVGGRRLWCPWMDGMMTRTALCDDAEEDDEEDNRRRRRRRRRID